MGNRSSRTFNALTIASQNGHDKVVDILIKAGADINHVEDAGYNALMIASQNGHDKVVDLLIKTGADINYVNQNGFNALMIASQNGHDKVVDIIVNSGADINYVTEIAQDTSFLNDRKNDTEDCLKTFSLTTTLLVKLIDVCFLAFENKHTYVIDTLSSMNYKTFDKITSTTLFHFFMSLFKKALNQYVQNDTKNELSTSTVSSLNDADVRNFKRSIDCYVQIVLLSHKNKTPSYDDVQEFVCDVKLEFSTMRDFDALHFFICQRCLTTIYSALNKEDRQKIFTLFLDLNYAEKTMQFLQDEHLLDSTAPHFSLSLVRDMLGLLWNGSHYNPEFALQLAEKNIVTIFTDFLTSIRDVQNSHTLFISKNVIHILHNIARREEGKKYFTNNIIFEAVLSLKIIDKATLFKSQLLLLLIEEECGAEKEAIDIVKRNVKERLLLAVRWNGVSVYGLGLPLSELLQGLSKFTEQDEDLKEIIPLLPRLKEILKHDDTDEHLFTTKCISKLSRIPEVSQQIVRDYDLSDLLNKSLSLGNKDITANVHSARWRSGLATGKLPPKTDILVSDEFPKEFRIDPTTLASGAFGSVHFVVDIYRPEDIQFVAKKTLRKINDADKCRDTFQQEASILISLKHERIVQFHGFQKTEVELLLFLEFVKMGTLSAFVKQRTRLNEALTRQFTIQILEGVKYLHENQIVHLDIKGNNILMADEANIKLTDFGLSTILNEEGVEAERGTTRYMAPEMINCPDGRIFKNACSLDIWSVGCTVVEMITGSPPNSTTKTSARVLFKIATLQKPNYKIPETSSQHLKDFLEKTFKAQAGERPSAETLLREDPFITG